MKSENAQMMQMSKPILYQMLDNLNQQIQHTEMLKGNMQQIMQEIQADGLDLNEFGESVLVRISAIMTELDLALDVFSARQRKFQNAIDVIESVDRRGESMIIELDDIFRNIF